MPNNKQTKADRQEFAAMDAAALRARLDEEKKKLWTDRFSMGKRQLTNTADIRKSRKRIARLLTYLGQVERGSSAGAQG